MLVSVKYSDAEIKNILKGMTIVCDTREQEFKHITDFYDKHKISHKVRKMDTGDYTAELMLDGKTIAFDKAITIDRKANLDELANNITADRERFEKELQRAKVNNTKFILLVEDSSWEDIYLHRYRSRLNEKSFMATLRTYQVRYGIDVQFVMKENAGKFIYESIYYFIRERLKE